MERAEACMLYRKMYERIERFYEEQSNKAMMITGARQVGKSYIVDKYGESNFESYIKIDFIDTPGYISLFDGVKSSEDILVRLSAEFGDKMKPGKTLIFFDEVQECPELITQIKYLVQEGSYSYILSGSLLGTVMRDIRSVPVGYLSIARMYPMDFEEFIIANGVGENVISSLKESFESLVPVDSYIHEKMMELFRLYLIVGGMPASVRTYLETKNLSTVAGIQTEILNLYREDIAKYDKEEKLYLQEIFDLIPSELNSKNKRFILKNLNQYTKFSKFENSFIWLRDAGVALPAYVADEPVVPLIFSKSSNLFKLFINDVGLLAAMYGNGIQLKLLKGEAEINYGAVYENAAAQELAAHGYPLYYYNNKKRGEVDFLTEDNGTVVPVEIKSGKDYYRHAALDNIMDVEEYGLKRGYVLCNGNIEVNRNIVTMPIYMLMFIQKRQLQDDAIYEIDISGLTD